MHKQLTKNRNIRYSGAFPTNTKNLVEHKSRNERWIERSSLPLKKKTGNMECKCNVLFMTKLFTQNNIRMIATDYSGKVL
jgi:hypothetical protein